MNQNPIIFGNHIPRGANGERCIEQRCIGYQRYGAVDSLASVYETVWSDGVVAYSLAWKDDHGNECISHATDRCPRIDVQQKGSN